MEIRNDSKLVGFIDGLNDNCKNMVKVFLNTDFEGGRHLTRVNKIPK